MSSTLPEANVWHVVNADPAFRPGVGAPVGENAELSIELVQLRGGVRQAEVEEQVGQSEHDGHPH